MTTPHARAETPAELTRQGVFFVIIGAVGVATNFTIYMAGEALGLHYVAASFLGWFVGLVVVFALNRHFTFGSDQPLLRSFIKTVGVYMVQQIVFAAGLVVAREWIGLGPIASYAVNLPIAAALSFAGLKFFAMARARNA